MWAFCVQPFCFQRIHWTYINVHTEQTHSVYTFRICIHHECIYFHWIHTLCCTEHTSLVHVIIPQRIISRYVNVYVHHTWLCDVNFKVSSSGKVIMPLKRQLPFSDNLNRLLYALIAFLCSQGTYLAYNRNILDWTVFSWFNSLWYKVCPAVYCIFFSIWNGWCLI